MEAIGVTTNAWRRTHTGMTVRCLRQKRAPGLDVSEMALIVVGEPERTGGTEAGGDVGPGVGSTPGRASTQPNTPSMLPR
jgi:hypothetical protein